MPFGNNGLSQHEVNVAAPKNKEDRVSCAQLGEPVDAEGVGFVNGRISQRSQRDAVVCKSDDRGRVCLGHEVGVEPVANNEELGCLW